MVDGNIMFLHSKIVEGSKEEKYLEDMCRIRWETMEKPCTGCKFKYPYKVNKQRCCIFPTHPKDWEMHKVRLMKFMKELVNIIEGKFNIKLSGDDINKGNVVFEYTNSLTGSKYIVYITRMSVNSVRILVRFKGESYFFVNGTVDTKGLKRILKGL